MTAIWEYRFNPFSTRWSHKAINMPKTGYDGSMCRISFNTWKEKNRSGGINQTARNHHCGADARNGRCCNPRTTPRTIRKRKKYGDIPQFTMFNQYFSTVQKENTG